MVKFTDNMGKQHFINLNDFAVLGVSDDDDLPRCIVTVVRKADKIEVCRLFFWLTASDMYSLLPADAVLD
jgi:hypothetical protein